MTYGDALYPEFASISDFFDFDVRSGVASLLISELFQSFSHSIPVISY